MAKGIFLANPFLNIHDVDVSASSELGRRAGGVIPFTGMWSGLLNVAPIGDAGDATNHDVTILGNQQRPQYSPLTAAGAQQFTAPETFATVPATISCAAGAKITHAVAEDRLYAIVADGSNLVVKVWDGAAWTTKASVGGIADHSGGISAASASQNSAASQNVYIAIADNTNSRIQLYRFNARSSTLGLLSEILLETNGTVAGVALATNGSTQVLLVTRSNGGGGFDVDSYSGGPGSLVQGDESINARFATAWTSGGDVRACGLTYNRTYGFIAAFRTGTSSPAKLRLLVSQDGDSWEEFKKLSGATAQPTTTTPWADALTCAITVENRRVFVWRATAATQDNPPTDVKMQWFDGLSTWSTEKDADGSVAVDTSTQFGAVNWRGTMFFGWRSTSSVITVRKCNELTTTNTGYYREIRFGEQMFIAGLDDDSQTALFFVANGSITAGDKFRIRATEYDYRVVHLLDDFMVKVWRGEHDAEQTIVFDAGSGRAFPLDTIALLRTNLPSITVELDDDPAFATPSTSQEILATVQTPTVTGADRNRVLFADNTFKEKQYAGGASRHWIKLSTGVFRILDSTHNSLIVDGSTTGATLAAATIFRDSMAYCWSTPPTPRRYLRLTTPALELPDEYYEISRVMFGLRLSLPRNFSNGFQRDDSEIEASTALKSGARFQTKLNNFHRVGFSLPWQVVELDKHLTPIRGIYGLGRGSTQLVAFWPFPGTVGTADPSGNQPDVYIGRFVEPLGSEHINQRFYSVGGMRFESEV